MTSALPPRREAALRVLREILDLPHLLTPDLFDGVITLCAISAPAGEAVLLEMARQSALLPDSLLMACAPHLSLAGLETVVSLLTAIPDTTRHDWCLMTVLPTIAQRQPADAVLAMLDRLTPGIWRANALQHVAAHLPDHAIAAALAQVRAWPAPPPDAPDLDRQRLARDRALTALAAVLAQRASPEAALTVARWVSPGAHRAEALVTVLAAQPPPARTALAEEAFGELRHAARSDRIDRDEALECLVPALLQLGLGALVVRELSGLGDVARRTALLCQVVAAALADPDGFAIGLAAADAIPDPVERVQAYLDLVERDPTPGGETTLRRAFAAAESIPDDVTRLERLTAVIAAMPSEERDA